MTLSTCPSLADECLRVRKLRQLLLDARHIVDAAGPVACMLELVCVVCAPSVAQFAVLHQPNGDLHVEDVTCVFSSLDFACNCLKRCTVWFAVTVNLIFLSLLVNLDIKLLFCESALKGFPDNIVIK